MNHPDFSRVPYASIPKLFSEANIQGPSQLIPVCYNGNEHEYNKHRSSFTIEAPIEKVWGAYTTIHPKLAWNTRMIKFGFVYFRQEDRYIYDDSESYPGLNKGQVFLINLNIIKGLQIAVAHEVDEVNQKEKTIKLCYLNTGKTAGSQWIRMTEAGPDKTQIEHKTLYKGTSFIRDRLLYPYFHEKAMGQFHQNMKEMIINPSFS